MKILKIQVLRGPNIWSNYRKKLIQVRLDLEEMENFPTEKLPGFKDRLAEMFPGMIEDEYSEGERGGFFTRLERGTWLGHVMEHIALEIQTLAGMPTGYGHTRGTGTKGIYNVVFAYLVEDAGLFAAEAALRIVDALSKNIPYDASADIAMLRNIRQQNCLGPSTKSIVDEAQKKGIPWRRLDSNSSIQLGYGANQKHFQATITSNTGTLSVETAGDKEATKQLLSAAMIPVAKGGTCKSEDVLKQIIQKIGYPIVIKPLNANQGKGASINVFDWETAVKGFEAAQKYSHRVLVEKFTEGFDFRILVIDNKFVAAAKRIPAMVTGNGKSTIQELIAEVNAKPERGSGHNNILTKIKVDRDTATLLEKAGYTLQTIPQNREHVGLKSTANLSTGGTAVDMTDEVHPENIFLAERIARIIGLDICGIDIIAKNLTEPLTRNGGIVLEVNAAPGFRMHLAPSEGKPRNVAAAVVNMLYPPGQPATIPIISVTGTNGKTTTTRLLAHMAKNKGYNVGYTTTDGIYINGFLVEEGDNTGPISGGFILNDPTVEFAVLETARGGILRSGLCFDECDVAVITNIREDHLGLNDINTIEELANVKAVLARSAKKTGWAVLNADDEQSVKIASELQCNIAYFSLDENNAVIQKRIGEQRPVAVYENGFITMIAGNEKIRIENVSNIPVTFNGNAKFMVANVLAASLAGYVWGFSTDNIRTSLQSFIPGLAQTPGRLNQFEFANFSVLVDYAHNPHGYTAIGEYLATISSKRKIGIISGIGDRRDEDIIECASIAGRMFDYIIIRQEHDLRGRTEENINALVIEGISSTGKNIPYETISKETEAVKRALDIAQKGDLVVALCDGYQSVIEIIKKELAKERSIKPAAASKKTIAPIVLESAMINNLKNKYHGRIA